MIISRKKRLVLGSVKVFSMILVVAFVVCLHGISHGAMKRYYNKAKGFSIAFPEKWQVRENLPNVDVMAISPIESSKDSLIGTAAVGVEDLPPINISLDKYYEISVRNAKKMLANFNVEEKGSITIDGVPAKWFVADYEKDGRKIKALFYVLVKGEKGFSIVCATVPQHFSKQRVLFDNICRSFKYEK